MLSQIKNNLLSGGNASLIYKNWILIFLTLVFVVLYILALAGKLKSPEEWAMVTRLEPMIFVIIGYYFGRLPAQQNEQSLKEEINRQARKAEAVQQAKEQVQQERESLEEKIKNVRIALAARDRGAANFEDESESKSEFAVQNSLINTAVKILSS